MHIISLSRIPQTLIKPWLKGRPDRDGPPPGQYSVGPDQPCSPPSEPHGFTHAMLKRLDHNPSPAQMLYSSSSLAQATIASFLPEFYGNSFLIDFHLHALCISVHSPHYVLLS